MNQRKKRIAEAFNNIAKPGQFFAAPGITTTAKRNEHRIVSDMLGNASYGKQALDAGCGIGGYTDILIQKGYDVVGVDIAGGMVEFCRLKYEGRVALAIADIGCTPFKEISFDLVLCIDTLQYVNHRGRQAIVESLVKLLRPGGTIILDIKNKWCPFFLFKRFKDRLAEFYTVGSIASVLRKQGCRNIHSKGVFFPKLISPIVVVKARKVAEG
ncbi:Ubiquinone biosynthesis O-methyltransferase [subsurface metagenome]